MFVTHLILLLDLALATLRVVLRPVMKSLLSLSPRLVLRSLFVLAAGATVAACGGGVGGGGGAITVGGAANTQCIPAQHNQGCYLNNRMQCDAGTSTWVLITGCTPAVCLESADPADATGIKRVTQCQAAQQPDIVSGNDSATTGGDATTGEDSTIKDVTLVNDMAQAQCGDGFCSAAESAQSCPADCATSNPVCGNGTCEAGETKTSCPADCGTSGPVCGNETCESGETQANCPSDCGSSGPVCGNGTCEAGETKANCAKDCGSAGPVCGNGTCESGETAQNCSKDCSVQTCCSNANAECGVVPGCGNCGTCASGDSCQENVCVTQGGDTCFEDNCATQISACDNSQGCIAIFTLNVLGACIEDNGCQDSSCLQNFCTDQLSQCQQTGCIDLWTCYGDCPQGDEVCLQGCLDTYGDETAFDNMATCYQNNCAP